MKYHAWAQAHAQGMAAAASYTAERRLSTPRRYSGATLAAVRRGRNEAHPCKIKGCKRTAYKAWLCRGHYDLVPQSMRVDCVIECMMAQHKIAAKHHRKQLAFVRSLIPSTPHGEAGQRA